MQQDAFCMLNIHQLCYMGWNCPGGKGTPEYLRELGIQASYPKLGDIKVPFEKPLDGVLTLDLQKRLCRFKGYAGF
jgi:hypothetical protein